MREFHDSHSHMVTARKLHICEECNGRIEKGESYYFSRVAGRSESKFYAHILRTHLECMTRYATLEELIC